MIVTRKASAFAAFLAVSVGCAGAQQAIGPTADKARKQVMQFEQRKIPLLLEGGAAFADWLQQVDSGDTVYLNPNGSINDKTAQVKKWRTGNMTQSANFQRDHEIFIYNDGNVAIVTYIGTTVDTVNGVTSVDRVRCADTWVRQNGSWVRVVHANAGRTDDPEESRVRGTGD